MRIGIVGLPLTGKTTLFRAVTGVPAEKLSFSGVKPNVEMVTLRDERLERLRDDYSPRKYTPARFMVLDFPGVEPAASSKSKAELIAGIRGAESLVAVLRGFDVPGMPAPDPVRELAELMAEFQLGDLDIAEKRLAKLPVLIQRGGSERDAYKHEKDALERVVEALEQGTRLVGSLKPQDEELLRGYRFLAQKPVLALVNRDESRAPDPGVLAELKERADGVLSAPLKLELDLNELDDEERAMFMEDMNVTELTRDTVIRGAYDTLGLISFFTVGEDEVRAWNVQRGADAVTAAGKIHTDLARGFITAEVVSYHDYDLHGGHKGAREHGRLRLEGKPYVVEDGDIINVRFSV